MLRQSLKSLGIDHMRLIEESGLQATQRAETVSVEGFVTMANGLDAMRGN